MNKLYVLLPAYNEEENLERLSESWQACAGALKKRFGLSLSLVTANDGSRDHTRSIGRRLEKEYHNFTLLTHLQNRGLGEALKSGIRYILEHCPDAAFVCVMDCDCTHDPRYVLKMLEKQRKTRADVVIASRFRRGSDVRGVSAGRQLASRGARLVYASLLGVRGVRDYTCGYRLYTREILQKAQRRFGGALIEESGFACMAELLYKLHLCGAVFAEIPFQLRYDFKKGASKMRVMKTAARSVRMAMRLKNMRRAVK